MRAVEKVVGDGAASHREGVDAVHVVDVAVAVVVEAVARDLFCVCPHVFSEVGVIEVDARVHDADDDLFFLFLKE